jgi:hypothetical protein
MKLTRRTPLASFASLTSRVLLTSSVSSLAKYRTVYVCLAMIQVGKDDEVQPVIIDLAATETSETIAVWLAGLKMLRNNDDALR